MAITTSQITITTMEGWYSGATPPLNPLIGDLWLDTINNEIKKYDGTNWIKQADTQGPQGPQGDSMVSRVAYWIKSSTKPEESDKPDPETGDMKGWIKGSEPPESALDGIQSSDKFWRIYKETYSNGESEYSKYSEVELIGSYEILNGLVQFRNGVATTENGITVIDGGKIHTKSIKADRIQVEDLEALKATIGGFHIGKNSIYSGTKQTIDSTERGIYFDSNGQSYFGDNKNFIRFYQSDNDNYKLQISADSLTFGSGISVEKSFEDIKSAADKAKEDAATALSTANTAKTNADAAQAAVEDAAKTATNFLDFNSTNGLLIGNKKSGVWSGYRSQILSNQFNILDENGNRISSFGANKIELGNNSKQSIIEMCGGLASLSSEVNVDEWGNRTGYILLAPTEVAQSKDYPFRVGIASGKRDSSIYLGDAECEMGSYLTPRAASINYIQSAVSGSSQFNLNEEYPEDGPNAYTSIGMYAGMGLTDGSEPAAGVDISAWLKNGEILNSLDLFGDQIVINGEPLADFVVERGTSGIWRYEKWHSGKAVAYMPEFYTYSNLTMKAAGNLYLSEARHATLPSGLFVDNNYIVNHEFRSEAGPVSIIRQSGSTKNKFLFKIYKVYSSSTGVAVKFSVKGRWQ